MKQSKYIAMNTEAFGQRKYVLMTAAHNEELHIEKTLQSVVSQTLLPERWVIVSDNSTDRTDEIVARYAERYGFIRFVHVNRPQGRNFRSKVQALHQGAKLFEGAQYDFIGNLDADISVGPEYFENLVARFEQNLALGIAGGFVYEEINGEFASRKINGVRDVAHAAQLVRRECYKDIGGYAVLEYGGEDWYAQTCARMKGWQAQAFPGLHIFHHRHTGEGSHLVANCIRLGRLDYSFGSDPAFEVLKCIRRMLDKPYFVGASLRLGAFVWSLARKLPRSVPDEFVAFLRREQKQRLASSFIVGRLRKTSTISREPAPTGAQVNR